MRNTNNPLPPFMEGDRMTQTAANSMTVSPGSKKSGVYFNGIEIPLSMIGSINPNSFLPASMNPSQTSQLPKHQIPKVIGSAITIPNMNERFPQRPLHAKPCLPSPRETCPPPGPPENGDAIGARPSIGSKRNFAMTEECNIYAMSHFDHGKPNKIESDGDEAADGSQSQQVQSKKVKVEQDVPVRKPRKISHDDLDAAITLSSCFQTSASKATCEKVEEEIYETNESIMNQ